MSPRDLSPERRARLLRQVLSHYERAKADRGDWDDRRAMRQRRWDADVTTRPAGPWREAPRLFVPITRDIGEKQLAIFHQTLWGQRENLKATPISKRVRGRDLELTERFLQWALGSLVNVTEPKDGMAPLTYTVMQDALKDEVGVMKVYPRTVPWEPPTQGSRRYLRETIQVDGLDLSSLYVPSDAEGLQYPQARYVIHEVWMTWDELQSLPGLDPEKAFGYALPTAEDHFRTGTRTRTVTERRRAEIERSGFVASVWDTGEGFATPVLEAYERFRLSDHEPERDYIVTVLPDAEADYQLARVVPLHEAFPVLDRPYRPLFPITIWPQARSWRGLSSIDRLESMQDMINRLHEQMINHADVSLLPFVFVNTFMTGRLPPNLRQFRPGELIPVFELNGVQMVQPRSLGRHGELIQAMLANVERDSAVSDPSMGRSSDRPNFPRTASGLSQILQAGRQTFAPLMMMCAGQWAEMIRFYHALWQWKLPASGMYAPIFPAAAPWPEEPGGLVPMNGGPAQSPRAMLQAAGVDIDAISALSPQAAQDLWARLFGGKPRMEMGEVTPEALDGLFDIRLAIDPNAAWNKQMLASLVEATEKHLMNWPPGLREAYKLLWSTAGQAHLFDEIWPKFVSDLHAAALAQRGAMAIRGVSAGAPQDGGPAAAPAVGATNGQAPAMPPEMAGMMGGA